MDVKEIVKRMRLLEQRNTQLENRVQNAERRWGDSRSGVLEEIAERVLERIRGKEIVEEAVEQVTDKIGEEEEITSRKSYFILYNVPEPSQRTARREWSVTGH